VADDNTKMIDMKNTKTRTIDAKTWKFILGRNKLNELIRILIALDAGYLGICLLMSTQNIKAISIGSGLLFLLGVAKKVNEAIIQKKLNINVKQ
jgi:hypothetical protein